MSDYKTEVERTEELEQKYAEGIQGTGYIIGQKTQEEAPTTLAGIAKAVNDKMWGIGKLVEADKLEVVKDVFASNFPAFFCGYKHDIERIIKGFAAKDLRGSYVVDCFNGDDKYFYHIMGDNIAIFNQDYRIEKLINIRQSLVNKSSDSGRCTPSFVMGKDGNDNIYVYDGPHIKKISMSGVVLKNVIKNIGTNTDILNVEMENNRILLVGYSSYNDYVFNRLYDYNLNLIWDEETPTTDFLVYANLIDSKVYYIKNGFLKIYNSVNKSTSSYSLPNKVNLSNPTYCFDGDYMYISDRSSSTPIYKVKISNPRSMEVVKEIITGGSRVSSMYAIKDKGFIAFVGKSSNSTDLFLYSAEGAKKYSGNPVNDGTSYCSADFYGEFLFNKKIGRLFSLSNYDGENYSFKYYDFSEIIGYKIKGL